MEPLSEPSVVGVRFSKVGKVYHFSASNEMDIKVGDQVVVETSRGWQLGQVAQILDNAERPPEGWKSIDRRATPRDLLLRQMWQMKEAEVVSTCKAKVVELRLAGVKIVSAEYSFDGARLTILFSTETDEKYDLKSLRGDMQKQYGQSQVEMRQIGPRDMAKVTCGMGACGLETRCCCLFLTEFSSISIRMAKEQGISLTPSEITGMCGRLRCCLIYEYDTYVDARAKLPKRNKRVYTPQGEGKVVDVVPLRGSVIVELPEVGRREFPGDEVRPVEDGAPQGVPAYRGTKQPSEIDQAVVGKAQPEEFVITDEPQDQPEGWNLATGRDEQADLPPARPPRPREGDRTRREGPGRGRYGDHDPQKPGRPGGPGAGQQPGGAAGQPWRGGPGQGPGGGARKKDRKPGHSAGSPENKPKGQPGAGNQPRSGRDTRRKRGRQRDEHNPEG
jgi:cell fate regulator YaaT (PSP1 superfamily)